MSHLSISVSNCNFYVDVNTSGEITKIDTPDNATAEALNRLGHTIDAAKNLLDDPGFWEGKKVAYQDKNAYDLATTIKSAATANKSFINAMKDRFVGMDPAVNQRIDHSIDKMKRNLLFHEVASRVHSMRDKLENNVPLTIDKSGIKCDNIGEDFSRSITQQEFQMKFVGEGFKELKSDRSLTGSADLDLIKKRSKDLLYNVFKMAYGDQFKESQLNSAFALIDQQKELTSLGNVFKNQMFFPLTQSADPRDQTAALLLFKMTSQELKNNMAEPFITGKTTLKIPGLPNVDITRPLQNIEVKKNQSGNIEITRTITYAMTYEVMYQPLLSSEVNPATGKTVHVSIDRTLNFSKTNPKSEQNAKKILENLNRVEQEEQVSFDVKLPSLRKRGMGVGETQPEPEVKPETKWEPRKGRVIRYDQ